jgi:TolC family type I secretion outer membrane protein
VYSPAIPGNQIKSVLRGLIVGTLTVAGMSQIVFAETLNDALARVYQVNPTLQAARMGLTVTNEEVPQAIANWLPTISASGSVTRANAETLSASDSHSNTRSQSKSLSISQTLFKGGSLFSTYDRAKLNVLQERSKLEGTNQAVLLSGVTAYMDVIRDRAIVKVRHNNLRVLQRRQQSVKAEFDLQRRTQSEMSQAQSRSARARAQLAKARATLRGSESTYEDITNLRPDELENPIFDFPLPPTFEDALEAAKRNHPSVIVARLAAEVARLDIDSRQRERLPSVALSASRSEEFQTSPQSAADSTTKTSTASLTMTVPIFQAGLEISKTRAARKTYSQKLIELSNATRTVKKNFLIAWEGVLEAEEQLAARREEIDAARVALDSVKVEAEVGRRTLLNVLNAEQEYLDAALNEITAQRDQVVLIFTLLQGMGRLTISELGLNVTAYDPKSDLEKIKYRFWTTSTD